MIRIVPIFSLYFIKKTLPITNIFGRIGMRTSRGRKFVASTQLEIGLRCGVSDTHREVLKPLTLVGGFSINNHTPVDWLFLNWLFHSHRMEYNL